ncbi:MAG TPA: TonB-dependent receptor [Prolixibacteraceae bacterium]|nr:TonB-dependent receptor [Prolixibacteraceae bacterium]
MNHLNFIRSHLVLILLLVFQVAAFAQGRKISGTVTDAANESLPGVNVVVKGTTIGTITDIDGKYSIQVNNTAKELVFSFIGYAEQAVAIGSNTTIDVVLKEDVQQLNEVVAIGYGVQKKKLNTGSSVNVNGENIQKLNTSNPIDALKGVSAGVNITQSNGQPGSDAKVFIRGVGTIGDATPLYIVDGVSTSSITHLAPSDIESIDILKDAASAAIYGSRAANGVILVTTKSAKQNKRPTISYDFYNGWHSVAKKPELLNAQQYIEIMDECNKNYYESKGKTVREIKWDTQVPNYDKIVSGENTGTDWLSEMIDKDAYVQSHAVNITGGTKMSSYSMGFSRLDEVGVVGKGTNNEYKRTNIRLNSDHVLWENKGLNIVKVGETLSFTNSHNPTVRTGNIYWNDLHNVMVASPTLPMYAEDNSDLATPYHYATNWNSSEANPIALMIYNTKESTNSNNSILGSFYTEIQPISNLVYRSQFGINAWYGNSRSYVPVFTLAKETFTTKDKVSQSMSQGYNWTFTNTISYKYLLGKHEISGLVGNEAIRNAQSLSLSTSNEETIFGDYEHAYIDNAKTISSNTSISGRDDYGWAMLSYFGRLSYNYDEKYMFTAVLRADGSSKFSEGHKWGVFPSVSAGWVATNENFMKNQSVISFLKIRGSWGQNGNQNVEDYQYLSTLSYTDATYYFGTNKTIKTLGAYPARVPNYDITWETSEQTDLGFDANFFKSKLNISFDWYRKDTRDWLVEAPALASYGTDPAAINGGSVRNTGIEIVASWHQNINDFKYDFTASLSKNKNYVIDIANEEKIIHGEANVLSQGTSEMSRVEPNLPIGYFWGYKTAGILQNDVDVANYVNADGVPYFKDSRPGDVIFVDTNKDGKISDDDKVMIGDPNPDVIIGFQLNTSYKGAYLQVSANGMFGHQIAKSYRSFVDSPKQNYTTEVYNRWHGEGTSNKMPILTTTPTRNTINVSDIYIEDGDFMRISNITLGYDFKALFKQLPIGEARLYVSGKNLFTFTKYSGMDPEVGYGSSNKDYDWQSGIDLGLYPSARTYLIGLSITF